MNFGPYPAKVTSVHDGDTVDLDVDLGFDVSYGAHVRLFGCNAPELKTPAGKAARDYLANILHVGASVTLISHGWDKYGGRCDGEVKLGDVDLTQAMIAAGQAKPWDGKGVKPT